MPPAVFGFLLIVIRPSFDLLPFSPLEVEQINIEQGKQKLKSSF